MVNMRQALGVDDFNQMSNYTGQLQNKRRSVGQKDYGLGGKALDMAAALGDAYNQYQPPETALGMMALPAKAVYGLGNMIVQDVGDKTKSIMGTDINNPAAMNQAATDAFGLAADTMAGGGVVSRMTDMPTGAVLGANVFQGGPHKYGPEGAAESLKHMSKGEGAQAYGYGRYDAESEKVGQQYKQNLAGRKLTVDGGIPEDKNPEHIAAMEVHSYGLVDGAKNLRKRAKSERYWDGGNGFSAKLDEAADIIESSGYKLPDVAYKEGDSYLYKHDLPDEDIARYLDWDAPLSEQPGAAKVYNDLTRPTPEEFAKDRQLLDELFANATPEELAMFDKPGPSLDDITTGSQAYSHLEDKLGGKQAASEALGKAGIPGLKYFDGMSRNKPTKDIKKSFQDELPDDAGFDEIDDLLGTGHFSPDSEEILQALKGDDWFGFDYPSQAISAALGKNINNWDPSARLTQAIAKARKGGTRNFVTWDQDVLNRMKLLERNGESMVDALSGVNNK